MPNNFATIQQSQLIMQRALALTFTLFPMLRVFAKGFAGKDGDVAEFAQLGQTVYSRKLGASTLGNFGDAASDFGSTDVTGQLRNFPQIRHSLTLEDINKSGNVNLIDEVALPMALKLAQAIVDRMALMVNRAQFGVTKNSIPSFVEVASGWTRANTVLAMKTACDERGIPENFQISTIAGMAGQLLRRYFIVNSTVESALLGDQMIVSQFNNSENAMAIKNGQLPQVDGFNFSKFAQMPNCDGNLLGWAGSPDALAYMARTPITPWDIMPDLAQKATWVRVIEPNSKFPVLMIFEGDAGTFGLDIKIVWLDTMEVADPDQVVRLVSGGAAGTGGTITGVRVLNAGYGYRNGNGAYAAPTVVFTGGGGTGAAGTATISANGAITGVTITNAGSGYTSPPAISFTPNTTGGAGRTLGVATAVAVVGGLK